QARRYATESGSSQGGSSTFLYLAGGAALAGAGYFYFTGSGSVAAAKVKEAAVPAKPAFTGGDQGFVSLKLADIENVNHNTKRLRFELPESNNVSGLSIASAVLTKYKGPDDEKPTLRPYTPISDEGRFPRVSLRANETE
ncbi:NADH-cytochrome b5 reductase, partial [Conoideocrella luteorostrata]